MAKVLVLAPAVSLARQHCTSFASTGAFRSAADDLPCNKHGSERSCLVHAKEAAWCMQKRLPGACKRGCVVHAKEAASCMQKRLPGASKRGCLVQAKEAAWCMQKRLPGACKRGCVVHAKEAAWCMQKRLPGACKRGCLVHAKEAAWCRPAVLSMGRMGWQASTTKVHVLTDWWIGAREGGRGARGEEGGMQCAGGWCIRALWLVLHYRGWQVHWVHGAQGAVSNSL